MKKSFFSAFIIGLLFLLAPVAAKAASLYLSPSSGSYNVGDSISVTVGVNTAGADINSAQATISYPTNLLEVTALSQSGIFSLWPVSPNYSNTSGTASFAGGVPGGYTGSSGTIITLTFQAKAAGTALVTVSGAKVLANDGLGTDLLSSVGSGSYIISVAAEPKPEPEPEPEPALDLPGWLTITSPTHPEQSLWYAHSDPSFEWNREDGVVGFSYSFDDQSDTTPDRVRDSTEAGVTYFGTADGVWYFHVRAQNNDGWGPASHYKVQIDTVPPLPFSIDLLDGKRTTVTAPRISFETTDDISGVHHYDLITDGQPPIGIDVGQTVPYALPELQLGKHDITAIAYDYANNSTAASNSFTIVSEDEEPLVVIDEEDKEGTLADKIGDTIENILPAPIKDITDTIGETIRNIKQNEVVVEVVDNIIEPLVTTTAIVAATSMAVAVATTINAYNLLYLFFRFGYFWLAPIVMGKKRRPWGVVFDSITGKPVPRAVVRIFSREFNKLKESQITDAQGRFGFIIDKGQYYISVSAPGYVYPSHILKTSSISQYDDIYRGDTIEVKEETGSVLSMNIPIDPDMKGVSETRLKWLKLLSIIGYFLEKISLPMLIVGTILSWVALILDSVLTNYIVLSLYGLLILLRYTVTKKFGRSVGLVRDSVTSKPIEMAIVRIYNADSGSIIGTRVTNKRGQFNALLAPGNYYLIIIKPGYENFQSKPVSVSRYRGYIRFTADLKSRKAKEAVLPSTGQDVDIQLESEPVVTDGKEDGEQPSRAKKKASKKQAEARVKKQESISKARKSKSTGKKFKKPPKKPSGKPPALPADMGSLSMPDNDES